MARVKYSALITNVKGKLSGGILQGNDTKTIIRTARKGKQSTTALSQKNKGYSKTNVSTWRALSDGQRYAWQQATQYYPQKDVHGNDYLLSGYALFIKLNGTLKANFNTSLVVPQLPQTLTDIGVISITDAAYSDWKLNWQNFLTGNNVIQVYASPAVSQGQGYQNSIMRLIKTISDTGVDNEQVGDAYVDYFKLFPTMGRVWFKTVIVNTVTGQSGSIKTVAVNFNQLSSGPLALYEARLAALGYPPLSSGLQTIYQAFFNSLQAGSNNYAQIKRLWWFGCEDVRQSYVSLVEPSATILTPMNSIESTFVAYRGMFPNGTNHYIQSNYNPSVNTGIYVLNSAGFSLYSRTDVNANYRDLGASDGTNRTISDLRETNNTYGTVNDATAVGAGIFVADSLGLFTVVRTNSTSIVFYKRGSNIGSRTATSTSIANEQFYISARNTSGTPDAYSTRNLLCVVFHSGSINTAELEASITAFATSIGANV